MAIPTAPATQKPLFPQEEDLVLCTVTAVQAHCVFVVLDEYNRRTGLIHISEVAPGRIRNIREFVKEGKKVVCKVLRIDTEKGHIDLSLRRVTEVQKREKSEHIKHEQLARKMLEHIAKARAEDPQKLYDLLAQKVSAEYNGVYAALEAAALQNVSLESLGIDKALSTAITQLVKDRIKPPEVKISGDLKLSTYAPDGVERVKNALAEAATVKGDISVRYAGAGGFHVTVKAPTFKEAERTLKEATEKVVKHIEKAKGTGTFTRHETK